MAQLMSAQGPLAREVRDVRLGLEVMSQRDMRDPWWVPAPLEWPPMTKPIKVALARIPADMDTDPEGSAPPQTISLPPAMKSPRLMCRTWRALGGSGAI